MLARLCGHHGNLCEVSPMGALTLIGAAVGAVGAIAAGRAQANAAEFNADMAQQQAERERQIAARDADDYRRSNSRLLATSRARRAGSGVASQGSPLLLDETTGWSTRCSSRSGHSRACPPRRANARSTAPNTSSDLRSEDRGFGKTGCSW